MANARTTTVPGGTRRWQLVVEYGPAREFVASAAFLVPVPEHVADEAARALLGVAQRAATEAGMAYGVSVRMCEVAGLGG